MLPESKWNRSLHFDSRNDAEGFLTTPAATHGRQIEAGGRCVADQTLSRIIAIPWPTPMHMVHKA